MAKTSAVYARIDPNLKNNAEDILSQLGISPTSAIQMLYSQIVITRGIPFELKLPTKLPLSIGSMSKDEFDSEITKGILSINENHIFSVDEVDAELKKEFGI